MKSGAHFSPCRRYRYNLFRRWSKGQSCLYLMLNPSTADEISNDPTVERCERRVRRMPGFGALQVANIFALRSTDPAALYSEPDPVGPDNDAWIDKAASRVDLVVCAWGSHGRLNGRGAAVLQRLRTRGITLSALKINADGTPAHPLYLPYSLEPGLMTPSPDSRR